MDTAKRTNQPFLAELAVIQLHKVHHATQDRCTKRIGFAIPGSHDYPQGDQLNVETIERICLGLGITLKDFFDASYL